MSKCVLFILNRRGYSYGDHGCGGCGACANCMNAKPNPHADPWSANSGLYNSVAFIVDFLNASGIASRMIQVNDETEIAQKIEDCGPTDVVLEAFFTDPTTLNALTVANPTIRFFVRNHSEMPMLSYDSRATEWIAGYLKNTQMHVSSNTTRSVMDLRNMAQSFFPHWDGPTLESRVLLLPNYAPVAAPLPRIPSPFNILNVGCLGAIRPQKNQFEQAICAVAVARDLGKKLQFHINGNRILHQGGGILRNIRALFANSPNAALIEHDWLPRPQFLDLCRRMDIGMQVSLTETFNIVSADFVQNDVPVVVSTEIPWCDPRVQANPTNGADIIKKMHIALRASSIIASNRAGLLAYNNASRINWLSVFGETASGYTDAPGTFKARPAITSAETHLSAPWPPPIPWPPTPPPFPPFPWPPFPPRPPVPNPPFPWPWPEPYPFDEEQ